MSSANIHNDSMEEDTFKILIASDCHLGYAEKDAVRGQDSFTTFKEILSIAKDKEVDFILLGGDLYHDNKPSRKTLHESLKLFRKYCMGNHSIKIKIISDQSENFGHCSFPLANYMDMNLNVSIPVFTIHGNHDDPSGLGNLSAIDLLSVTGLANYFGKVTDLNHIKISPLLFTKGRSKLALYGLGSIRDERLHRLFKEGHISSLRPVENPDEWFNLFVIHQNRAKHGTSNYIPEHFLEKFIDLVIWGHEHECRINPEWNSQQNFYVVQPGSSVATSLCHGESVPKHVAILQIRKKEFKVSSIPLHTVRQFFIEDIDLTESQLNITDPDLEEKIIEYCKEMVDDLLRTADLKRSGHPEQPEKPLIRLRVDYTEDYPIFNIQRFGQQYVDKVANTKDIILFRKKKKEIDKSSLTSVDFEKLQNLIKDEGMDKSRVEDIVKKYFQNAKEKDCLSLLSEVGMGIAVQEFIEKSDKEAINEMVTHQVSKVQQYLKDNEVKDESIIDKIEEFKLSRMKQNSEEILEAHKVLGKSRNKETVTHASDSDEDTLFGNRDKQNGPRGGKTNRRGHRAESRNQSRGSTRAQNNNAEFNKVGNSNSGIVQSRSRGKSRARAKKSSAGNRSTILDIFKKNKEVIYISSSNSEESEEDFPSVKKKRKTDTL